MMVIRDTRLPGFHSRYMVTYSLWCRLSEWRRFRMSLEHLHRANQTEHFQLSPKQQTGILFAAFCSFLPQTLIFMMAVFWRPRCLPSNLISTWDVACLQPAASICVFSMKMLVHYQPLV